MARAPTAAAAAKAAATEKKRLEKQAAAVAQKQRETAALWKANAFADQVYVEGLLKDREATELLVTLLLSSDFANEGAPRSAKQRNETNAETAQFVLGAVRLLHRERQAATPLAEDAQLDVLALMAMASYLVEFEDPLMWLNAHTNKAQHFQMCVALQRLRRLLQDVKQDSSGSNNKDVADTKRKADTGANDGDDDAAPPTKKATSSKLTHVLGGKELRDARELYIDASAQQQELQRTVETSEEIVGSTYDQATSDVIKSARAMMGRIPRAQNTYPLWATSKDIEHMDACGWRKLNKFGRMIAESLVLLRKLPEVGPIAQKAGHTMFSRIAALEIPEGAASVTVPKELFQEEIPVLRDAMRGLFFDLTAVSCVDPENGDDDEVENDLLPDVYDLRLKLGVAWAHHRATTKTSTNSVLNAQRKSREYTQSTKTAAAVQQDYATQAMKLSNMDLTQARLNTSYKGAHDADSHKAEWFASGVVQHRRNLGYAAGAGSSGSGAAASYAGKKTNNVISDNSGSSNTTKKGKNAVPRAQVTAALAAILANGFIERRAKYIASKDKKDLSCWWCAATHTSKFFSDCPAFKAQANNGGHSLEAVQAAIVQHTQSGK